MSVLNDPGVQKVWMGGELIFDRAQGGDLSALGFREYATGADDGCSNGAQEVGIEGA